MAHRANVYPLRVNHCSPMEATSPIEPGAFFAATDADGTLMPIDRSFEGHFARSISLATRSAGPAHAFRPRFLDRDNFLALS